LLKFSYEKKHSSYRRRGQVASLTDSLGNTHYGRDELYRVTSVTDPHGFTVSFDYDEANNVTKITYPGNKEVIYTYDALNRLKTVTNWLDQTATYQYDDAGRLTSLTHFNGIQTTYNYDNANRLTFLEHKNPVTNSIIARYTYVLDGNGNRTSVEMIAPLMPAIETVNELYTYNPEKNRLLDVGGTALTYDDEGQLQSKGMVSHNFDFEHRLISAGTSVYAYDGVGTRLRALNVTIETRYIYDLAGNLLAEANSNNDIIRYYVHGLGLLAMITPVDETFSYHFDGTGNTVAITDQAKQVQNTYAYTPFGMITKDESFHQPFTFSGEYGVLEEPSGLYYMRARYYDPQIGRFISEDPIRFAGGDVNLYAYVGNNPVNFADPYGLFYFGKRRLTGLPFEITHPAFDPVLNYLNLETSHEHGFFEDQTGGDIGFGPQGRFSGENPAVYRRTSEHYDDAVVREVIADMRDTKYCLIGNNCQNWAEGVRLEYNSRVLSGQYSSRPRVKP
jgi:RHS repeat-associated protein